MIEVEVDIETPDGVMNTIVMHPEDGGPFPVAICFIDSCGIRPDFLDMPRRLAATGYCVATPNMYYRKAREVNLDPDQIDSDDPTYGDQRAQMWQLNRSITPQNFEADTRAAIAWLDAYPHSLRGSVGAFGYCLGGRLSLWAAAFVPDRVAAAGSFHGGGFVTDTPLSLHKIADRIKAEVYIAHAGTDKYVPLESLQVFDKALAAAGVRRRVEVYSQAHHGFTIPGRNAYHAPSAVRAWERLFALFRRNLPQAPASGDLGDFQAKIRVI